MQIVVVQTDEIFKRVGQILSADPNAAVRIGEERFVQMLEMFKHSEYSVIEPKNGCCHHGMIFYKRSKDKKTVLRLYVDNTEGYTYGGEWHILHAVQDNRPVFSNNGEIYYLI